MLKAIIFDVGGVLIRTHSRQGREKWAARVGLPAMAFEDLVFNGESGREAQLGRKTTAAHWRWLGEHFGLSEAETAEMRRDFFAGDVLNKPLLAQIGRLRQAGYRTGLLSNNFDDSRRLWTTVYPLLDHFDGVVISAEAGLMKPEPEIYHLAAKSAGVKANQALFVDDFMRNIAGAQKAGMQTIHFTDPAAVQQQLAALTGVE